MFEILTSRSHIFCQLTCLLLGVFVILKTGFLAPVSTEWVFVGVNSMAPAIIVVLLNPLIMMIVSLLFDVVTGLDNDTASYEATQSLMHLIFCLAAALITICQLMVFTGI